MGVERITAHGRKLSGVEHIKEESRLLRGGIAAELASDSTHFAESDTQLLKVHGTYQQYDRDDATARKLWEISEKMTGLTPAQPAGT